jgi:hypothetical protein
MNGGSLYINENSSTTHGKLYVTGKFSMYEGTYYPFIAGGDANKADEISVSGTVTLPGTATIFVTANRAVTKGSHWDVIYTPGTVNLPDGNIKVNPNTFRGDANTLNQNFYEINS